MPSDFDLQYDAATLDRLVAAVDFRSASVTFSAKVSVKEGDCYRGVESGMTVSLRLNGMEGMPRTVVKLSALKHAPMLMAKVYTDLVLGDVMSQQEAQARIAKAAEFYERAYTSVLEDHERKRDVEQRGVRDTFDAHGGADTGSWGRAGGDPARDGGNPPQDGGGDPAVG